MDNESIDPSMLYLEVPVYTNDLQLTRCQDIVINEGEADSKVAEMSLFGDRGGGSDIILDDANVKHTIFWKSHDSSLELFEVSLQENLMQSYCQIEFQNSKVLPNVHIYQTSKNVIILCATLHACHRIILNTGQLRRHQSVLSGISSSLFSDPNHNFYFTQVQQVSCFASGPFETGRQSTGALFTFGTNTGQVILLKMPKKGQPVLSNLNQASRMSRLWSGINPWAANSDIEAACDITLVQTWDSKVVGVCKDNKLRIWSVKKQDCIDQIDLCQYLPNECHSEISNNHKIRSAFNETDNHDLVSVYMSFEGSAMFLNFQFDDESNALEHVSTIQCGTDVIGVPSSLVDFQLSSSDHLWALWLDAEEEMSLSLCDVNLKIWHDVALASSPAQEITIPSHLSVQETFLKHLFTSGNFSSVAISKALSIQQRTAMSSRNASWRTLRENVIKAIKNEIVNTLPENASLSETIATQMAAWQSFYQACLQYQKFVSKPIGMTTPSGGGAFILKKEYISSLVSVSQLEAVCRGADSSCCSIFFPEGANLDDLGKLLNCLSLLASILSQEYLDTVLQSLVFHDNPIDAVKEELDTIKELMNDRADSKELQESLIVIGDVMSSASMLLACLDPGTLDCDLVCNNNRKLSGDFGIEVLARVLQRYVNDRLQLSVLLLILSIFFDELQETLPPRVAIYVQAYSAIKWAVSTETEHVSQASLENTLQTLSVRESPQSQSVPFTLINYYLRNEGGMLLQELLNYEVVLRSDIMPKAAAALVQLLWPLGPTMSFPEFLLSKAQFSRLQHYLDRELYPWCDFCPAYTTYMLGHCHLHNGQYNKAVRTFLKGSRKVSGEELFLNRLMQIDENVPVEQVESHYFTKIMQIFEDLDLAEQVILVAKHAIQKVSPNDPSMPILCSSVFRQSLVLHLHEDAYQAIVWNTDPEHRKDCLRSLVVALCDRKEYKTLVEFPYDELHDDLVNILEHRARCSDLMTSPHKYYDLLYAFHVYRGNYRRAASTMYEHSWRIGSEHKTVAAYKKKQACLISAATCLMLVEEENRWIVHPANAQAAIQSGGKSPKRDYDGEELEFSEGKRKVVVCELTDIQEEIVLVEARLKLAKETKDDSTIGATMTCLETVSMLCHNGLYEDAFSICVEFKLSLTIAFQSLTTRCIQASYDDEDTETTWISRYENATLSDGHSSPADVAWRVLKEMLEKYGDSSGCYRAVLRTLLGYNVALPAWFVNVYKRRNCAELIRMLVCYNYLEQATMICIEYIEAVMGVGPEHFNIKDTLKSGSTNVWLPYNEFEQLLFVLRETNEDPKFSELHDLLKLKIDYYKSEAEKISVIMSNTSYKWA